MVVITEFFKVTRADEWREYKIALNRIVIIGLATYQNVKDGLSH